MGETGIGIETETIETEQETIVTGIAIVTGIVIETETATESGTETGTVTAETGTEIVTETETGGTATESGTVTGSGPSAVPVTVEVKAAGNDAARVREASRGNFLIKRCTFQFKYHFSNHRFLFTRLLVLICMFGTCFQGPIGLGVGAAVDIPTPRGVGPATRTMTGIALPPEVKSTSGTAHMTTKTREMKVNFLSAWTHMVLTYHHEKLFFFKWP